MRVMILGGSGMLGHKTFQVLRSRFEVFATFRSTDGPWRSFPMYKVADTKSLVCGVDAVRFDTVERAFAKVRPDAVINCIGLIKQLKEAKDPLLSITLNALFPHRLANLCEAAGTRLIHLSTDCVFSGKKGHYTEDDLPDPMDLYGRTKLLGEVDQPRSLTIRTSIFGRDFLKNDALLEWFLSQRGGRVRGFAHAIYTGFPTQVLSRIIGDLLAHYPQMSGLYQVASTPISKYDLLLRIRDAMRLDIEIERDEEFQCDRSLDGSRFLAVVRFSIPTWDEMIAELADDTTPYDEWRERYAAL